MTWPTGAKLKRRMGKQIAVRELPAHQRPKKLDEDVIRAMLKQGHLAPVIAKEVGCHPSTVLNHIYRMGLQPNRVTRKEIPVDEIMGLYNTGMACTEIGKRYGVSGDTINKRLKEAGVKMRNNRNSDDELVVEEEEAPSKTKGWQPPKVRPAPSEIPVLEPLDEAIMASGGSWRRLSDVADHHGLSITKVTQLWHARRKA